MEEEESEEIPYLCHHPRSRHHRQSLPRSITRSRLSGSPRMTETAGVVEVVSLDDSE